MTQRTPTTNMVYFDIKTSYAEWIRGLAFSNPIVRERYSRLLDQLDMAVFSYSIPMDGNLYAGGIYLRTRFAYEFGVRVEDIEAEFEGCPCSLLEMMVALAFKCEESIMHDPEKGDQTSHWFTDMLNSSHLACMDNDNYDPMYVDERITAILNRDYDYDGNGGLFTVPNARRDFRTMEIWYQMHQYLIYLEKGE